MGEGGVSGGDNLKGLSHGKELRMDEMIIIDLRER